MLRFAAILRWKQEHDYGSTHVLIDPWSSAATSLNMARESIRDEDRAGPGKDVDPNHITVRYGLLNDDDLSRLRAFLAAQSPFEAQVMGIELFPPSQHSDGTVPVVARMDSPGLHLLEAEIDRYADFKEKSFPDYKPHCTLAYVTPEAAPRYATLPVRGTCLIHSVTISHASGTQETIPFGGMAQKADPAGRYVTPFVSFDKQGDDQLRMIASLNSSRLATWGFTAEAEARGLARYRITAVLDGRTSEFCRFIDGHIFDVPDAREKVIEALNVQDPEDLAVVQPWPKQTKQAMAEFREMSDDELVDRGLHIPPYHPYCRTILRPVTASGDELDSEDLTPTLPDDVQTFQPVTLADLQELGIDATQDDVDQWNAQVGMSPVELLSKFSGMTPQDVMTDGVGAKAIQFDDEGNIGFNARGEANGVEFKLGALLDPFTGIYYLTQADLLTGTPAAERSFLKQMFSALLDMGEASPTATALALNVAGNAAYYAKLGFLPSDIEWDSIRQAALDAAESGPLQEALAALAPEDRDLVAHLLQDQSASALSALVDLPFEYEGKTIGEIILEETGGTWELDLEDSDVVDQARAYLSDSVVKFDENEPRDAKGRWTAGAEKFLARWPYHQEMEAYAKAHGEAKLDADLKDFWANQAGGYNVPSMDFQLQVIQAGRKRILKERRQAKQVAKDVNKPAILAQLKQKYGLEIGDTVYDSQHGVKGVVRWGRDGQPYVESNQGKHLVGARWQKAGA